MPLVNGFGGLGDPEHGLVFICEHSKAEGRALSLFCSQAHSLAPVVGARRRSSWMCSWITVANNIFCISVSLNKFLSS